MKNILIQLETFYAEEKIWIKYSLIYIDMLLTINYLWKETIYKVAAVCKQSWALNQTIFLKVATSTNRLPSM